VLAGYGEEIFNFSKARKKKLAHFCEKFQVFTDTESPPIYSAGLFRPSLEYCVSMPKTASKLLKTGSYVKVKNLS
jgi:hypothetical protein